MGDEAWRISMRWQGIALYLPKIGLEGKGNYAGQVGVTRFPIVGT